MISKALKKSILPLFLAVAIFAAAFSGCAGSADNLGADSEGPPPAQEIGTGNTAFIINITDDKENVTRFNVHTDEKTVGAALLQAKLIEGDETKAGLYVKAVNGLKADYEADGTYWEFCIDGDLSATSVDLTYIEPDKAYAFIYTNRP